MHLAPVGGAAEYIAAPENATDVANGIESAIDQLEADDEVRVVVDYQYVMLTPIGSFVPCGRQVSGDSSWIPSTRITWWQRRTPSAPGRKPAWCG